MATTFYGQPTWADWAISTGATTNVWPQWISSATATGQWQEWIGTQGTNTATVQGWYAELRQPPPPPTQEQLDAIRVAAAAAEVRRAQERHDRDQAVQRAETLLHDHLNSRQRRSLAAHNRFRVRGQSGRWYEIERGHHANVFGLGARGKRTETLCVYPTGAVPEADAMLAQKLYLEANEERLRQVAHITPLP